MKCKAPVCLTVMSNEPDTTTEELSRIEAEEMDSVSLVAAADVSELPAPARNYLADQARQIERAFCETVNPDAVATEPDDRLPFRIEKVGPEVVVDLSDASDDTRRQAYDMSREHEQRFMQEVENQRETYAQ